VEAVKAIHVLVVEDDQSVTDAVTQDFGRNGVAVTVSRTLADARAILRQGSTPVNVVVLELRLPDGRGESLLPDIEACPRQPAAIITSASLHELLAEALEYRPVAVAKPISTAALLRMVKTAAAGYTRPTIRRFVRRFDLSRRETEVVAILAQGLSAKDISKHLGCSEKTVYAHLARICEKASCRDYHALIGRLFAFTCQAMGHTPPDHAAFVDRACSSGGGAVVLAETSRPASRQEHSIRLESIR
jgi:DNA-binding NarL/FixJ family response regulator